MAGTVDSHGVPTTIYYYFKNKEELLDKIKFNVTPELDDYIFSRLNRENPIEEQIKELINAFIDWSIAHPKLLDLVFETLPPKTDLTEAELAELYRTNFKIIELLEHIAAKQGLAAKDVKANSMLFTGLAYGVVKLYLNKRVLPDYWNDITPLKEQMFEMIFNTLKC